MRTGTEVLKALLLTTTTTVFATRAEAEDAPAVLVQAFADAGPGARDLQETIFTRLQRMGVSVRSVRLRGRDASCREEACLTRLARAQQVSLILGSDVTGEGEGQVTRLWLWDAKRGSMRGEQTLTCRGCDGEQRAQEAALVAGGLLEVRAEVVPTEEAAHATPRVTPEPEQPPALMLGVAAHTAAPAEQRYLTPLRSAAIGLFGSLTLASFVLGGVLQGVYGSNVGLLSDEEKKTLRSLPVSAVFGVGGGFAAGLVLSLALPSRGRRTP